MKYDIKIDGEKITTQPLVKWDSDIGGGEQPVIY